MISETLADRRVLAETLTRAVIRYRWRRLLYRQPNITGDLTAAVSHHPHRYFARHWRHV